MQSCKNITRINKISDDTVVAQRTNLFADTTAGCPHVHAEFILICSMRSIFQHEQCAIYTTEERPEDMRDVDDAVIDKAVLLPSTHNLERHRRPFPAQ